MAVWMMVAACGCVALLLTPAVIHLGYHFNWVDKPDARKQHQRATVRVGGLAIVLGMVVAFVGLALVNIKPIEIHTAAFNVASFGQLRLNLGHWAIIGGSLAAFGLGFADDVLSLSPGFRLLCQGLSATLLWMAGVQIEMIPLPGLGWVSLGVLSLPVTFLWLAGVTNAINWIDGLDGLAAGVGTLASLALAVTCGHLGHHVEAVIALCLASSLLGFLYHNARPAKLFMGDGGAYLVGFLLASLSITGLMQTDVAPAVALPYLILGVPIADMAYVILGRLRSGKSPFFPDRRHLHHRLLDSGFDYNSTIAHIYGLVAFTGASAAVISGSYVAIGLLIGLLFLGMAYHYNRLKLALQTLLTLVKGHTPQGSL